MFQFVLNVPQRVVFFFFPVDSGFVIANLEKEGLRLSLEAKIGFRAHFFIWLPLPLVAVSLSLWRHIIQMVNSFCA